MAMLASRLGVPVTTVFGPVYLRTASCPSLYTRATGWLYAAAWAVAVWLAIRLYEVRAQARVDTAGVVVSSSGGLHQS